MEELFKSIRKEYENDVKNILMNNKINYKNSPLSYIKFETYDTVIPYIEPLPKIQFFIYTPVNINSNDEPILRYKPFFKTKLKNIYMYFYKDTTIFDSPFNHQTELLIRLLQRLKFEKKLNLTDIENYFHIKHKDLLKFISRYKKKIKQKIITKNQNYSNYFCSICLIFGCKMHIIHKNLCFYADTNECYCSLIIKKENYKEIYYKDQNDDNINKYLNIYNGDVCMVSYMLLNDYKFFISCNVLKKVYNIQNIVKEKTIVKSKKFLKSKMFYDICNHRNKCNKNILCICYRNNTGCSPRCLCTNCDFNKTNINLKEKFLEKKTFCGRSSIAGTGCFAGEFIKKDEFIIEYTGEYISKSEADRRANFYDLNKVSYIFDLSLENKKASVDAMFLGNNSRFINHSKNANVISYIVEKDLINHIFIYALKDININEELFMDYKYDTKIEGIFGFK